jgi:hypothetical protein
MRSDISLRITLAVGVFRQTCTFQPLQENFHFETTTEANVSPNNCCSVMRRKNVNVSDIFICVSLFAAPEKEKRY